MSDEIKIDKGIPSPDFGLGRFSSWRSVARKMEDGDSVLFSGAKAIFRARRLFAAGKSSGFLMRLRSYPEGIRVWKICGKEDE